MALELKSFYQTARNPQLPVYARACIFCLPSALTLRDSVARDSGTLQPFLPTRSQVNPAHTYPPRPITPAAAGQGRLPSQPIPSLHHSLSMLGQSSVLNPATRLMLWLSSSMAQNTNAIATTWGQQESTSSSVSLCSAMVWTVLAALL